MWRKAPKISFADDDVGRMERHKRKITSQVRLWIGSIDTRKISLLLLITRCARSIVFKISDILIPGVDASAFLEWKTKRPGHCPLQNAASVNTCSPNSDDRCCVAFNSFDFGVKLTFSRCSPDHKLEDDKIRPTLINCCEPIPSISGSVWKQKSQKTSNITRRLKRSNISQPPKSAQCVVRYITGHANM